MSDTITAVVPVKGNSSRLPNKNILPFGESNLLQHKIEQLKQVKGLHEIIVSSDSDEMLAIGEKCGVKAIKRPIEYANESVPFGMFLEYLCDTIEGEHLLYACATSPLSPSGRNAVHCACVQIPSMQALLRPAPHHGHSHKVPKVRALYCGCSTPGLCRHQRY